MRTLWEKNSPIRSILTFIMNNTLCFLFLPFTLGLVMNCQGETKESIELKVKSYHLGENKLISVDEHQSLADTEVSSRLCVSEK